MNNALIYKHNKWISTEEIEVLNHNLNYSNWTDVYACQGKWKIGIIENKESEAQLNVYMPTARWGESHSGYWTIYSGRFEIRSKELLIWGNPSGSKRLNYLERDNQIKLVIYGRQIVFEKE